MVENGSRENPAFTASPEKEVEFFPKKRSSVMSTKKVDLSSDLPEKPIVSNIIIIILYTLALSSDRASLF